MLGFLFGHWEVLVIAGVIVLVFFGRRIPEMMRSLGKGVTQFKKGLKERDDEDQGEGRRDADHAKALPAPEGGAEDTGAKQVQAEQVEAEPKGTADTPPGRSSEQ